MSVETLAELAISPTGFVFDPRSGASFTVNGSGRLILEALRDGGALADVVRRLRESFDVGTADLERDAFEYVRRLQEQGLLPADFELS